MGRSRVLLVFFSCSSRVPAATTRLRLAKFRSPGFQPRAQVHFVRPGGTGLPMQLQVDVGNRLRIEDAIARLQGGTLGKIAADEFGVDGAIDDDVGDMQARRPELARQAWRQRPQAMLGAGEGGIAATSPQAGGGAGEPDGAALARQHGLGDLPPHQKAGKAGHLPDLEVDAGGGFRHRKAHVGTDIEDRHLDRPDLALDGSDQRHHLFLLARIRAEGPGTAALLLDLLHQGNELVGAAALATGIISLAGKAPGHRPAGGIPGTDHKSNLCVRHGPQSSRPWLPTASASASAKPSRQWPRTEGEASAALCRLAAGSAQEAGVAQAARRAPPLRWRISALIKLR